MTSRTDINGSPLVDFLGVVERNGVAHILCSVNFNLDPPVGVGPLRIGMSRVSAEAALLSLCDPAQISSADQPGVHVFRPSGLMISMSCARDELESVELGRSSVASDVVRFRGVDVFGLSAQAVVSRLSSLMTITAAPEAPASFVAPDLLLSFWRPFAADDEPDEEQGYYFNSVLLARPGYYDTPAEAAARLDRPGG